MQSIDDLEHKINSHQTRSAIKKLQESGANPYISSNQRNYGFDITKENWNEIEEIHTQREISMIERLQQKRSTFTGLDGYKWTDIEITNNELGKPFFKLHGKVADTVSKNKVFLSISHTFQHAIAFVIIEGEQKP